MLQDFHFLRPLWLLGLIPAVGLLILLVRRKDPRRAWKGVVAEHLLPFVVSDAGEHRGARPHLLLVLVLVTMCVALAGPAWVRQPAPFADDQAALVIAVEVSPTMLARDVQPSRLERAAQKIKDLLERRRGSASALVAYAGSAHLVLPLTEDGDLVASFAGELKPRIMPVEGDAAAAAVDLARRQLTDAGRSGSVLLVTDGVPPEAIRRLAASRAGLPRVHVYGIAAGNDAVVPPDSPPAPALDRPALERAAEAGGGSLVLVTPDGSDVARLARVVETQLTAAAAGEGGERWRDAGYWLVPWIALAALWWFRPGWTVRWVGVVFLGLLAGAGEASAEAPRDWFVTRDQQAQRLFNRGDFAAAAPLFTEPMRQGVAWYRAGDYGRAAAVFARTGSAEGLFNRGNALMRLGNYPAAIASYELALQKRPGWPPALENLQLARVRLEQTTPAGDPEDQQREPEEDERDETSFDESVFKPQGAGSQKEPAEQDLSDEALRARWLRRVESSPADFLQRKFAFQHARENP